MIIEGYVFTYLYIVLILFITNILSEVFKVKKIITRKIVHIGVTFSYFIMHYYFGYTIHMVILPITFVVINYISYKKNIIKGMENKESLGTIFYPISVLIMATFTYFNSRFDSAYAIGLFCMGLGDGFAPLFAGFFKSKKLINNKTITGSLTVLIISLLVAYFFGIYFNLDYKIIDILIIGFSAALIELIGVKGYDNLYLPLGIFIVVIMLGV